MITVVEALKSAATSALRDLGMPNVTDGAYYLGPSLTPRYQVLALELPELSGYDLRLTGTFHYRAPISYEKTLSSDPADIVCHTAAATVEFLTALRDHCDEQLGRLAKLQLPLSPPSPASPSGAP